MKNLVVEKKKGWVKEIPYVNITAQHAKIKERLLKAMSQVLDHGQFVLGPEVQQFEERFAELCGVRYAIAVNSGTDALMLALRVLGIDEGDEVITVPNSFISTTSCIVIVGARPIFVDVRDDYNMNPDELEGAITPKTKAILPVHLTGKPAEMDTILEIARKYKLSVVEDCAQAVLAEYRGRRVGSFGRLGCFSLHPLKTLSACGDGGVITTNEESFCQQLKKLRNLGLENRDLCILWSSNSRLDTLQAASLLVKMDYLDEWTEGRRRNARRYQKALSGIQEIKLPIEQSYEKAVYHTFVIQAERRDELKDFLAAHGIGTGVHYPLPIHLQTAAVSLGYHRGSFPVAERLADQILSLPIYPELGLEEIEYIAGHIHQFYRQ